ncbi:MAG TPA: DUF5722 domain-containing protein [Gaiellaceae bacterium]|nr:DUF5722 domain-containing protein [Gaiellaceae bacterium]
MTVRIALSAALSAAVVLGGASSASASPAALYGIQDDAWLEHGPGTLESRLDELARMGVDVVRYTVRWDRVAPKRPVTPRDPRDAAYDWWTTDAVLRGLHRHGIDPVVTLYGAPRWANGGRPPNWAPTAGQFGDFAHAAASRYPWARLWTIWNEPNRSQWLRPTSPRTYVEKLLNPAYAQIRSVIEGARVGGGMTAPRAGSGGISPIAWITSMGDLGARLDAYAHHPYPSRPQTETPWGPACDRCSSLTMADLERLVDVVHRSLGRKRVWLTEFGYQTNPPDHYLGVSVQTQAAHVASAVRRVQVAPYVDMLIFFLFRDDAADEGWQSGFTTVDGERKPAYAAFRFPLSRTSRRGDLVEVWGQIRPRDGPQPYRIEILRNGRRSWLTAVRRTDPRGVLAVTVRAPAGSVVRLWSVRDRAYGSELRV